MDADMVLWLMGALLAGVTCGQVMACLIWRILLWIDNLGGK